MYIHGGFRYGIYCIALWLRRTKPRQKAIWMCYIIQVIFVLCVICVLTMMVLCGDIRMQDYCQEFFLLVTCIHPDYYIKIEVSKLETCSIVNKILNIWCVGYNFKLCHFKSLFVFLRFQNTHVQLLLVFYGFYKFLRN